MLLPSSLEVRRSISGCVKDAESGRYLNLERGGGGRRGGGIRHDMELSRSTVSRQSGVHTPNIYGIPPGRVRRGEEGLILIESKDMQCEFILTHSYRHSLYRCTLQVTCAQGSKGQMLSRGMTSQECWTLTSQMTTGLH